MAKWEPKAVTVADMKEGEHYFLVQGGLPPHCLYYSRGLNGRLLWSVKPGIAIRFPGDGTAQEVLTKNPQYTAILVPADADKRWRARTRRYFK